MNEENTEIEIDFVIVSDNGTVSIYYTDNTYLDIPEEKVFHRE